MDCSFFFLFLFHIPPPLFLLSLLSVNLQHLRQSAHQTQPGEQIAFLPFQSNKNCPHRFSTVYFYSGHNFNPFTWKSLKKKEKCILCLFTWDPVKYWEPACLRRPHLPPWSTEQLVEHVGQEGGRLIFLSAFWDLSSAQTAASSFQGLNFGSQVVHAILPSNKLRFTHSQSNCCRHLVLSLEQFILIQVYCLHSFVDVCLLLVALFSSDDILSLNTTKSSRTLTVTNRIRSSNLLDLLVVSPWPQLNVDECFSKKQALSLLQ